MWGALFFIGRLFASASKEASDKRSGTGQYYTLPNGVRYYMDKRGVFRLTNGDPIGKMGENWINCKNYKVIFEEGKWKREKELKRQIENAERTGLRVYLKTYSPEESKFDKATTYVMDIVTGKRIAYIQRDIYGKCFMIFYEFSENPKMYYKPKIDWLLDKREAYTVEITTEEFEKIVEYVRRYEVHSLIYDTCRVDDYTNRIYPHII